MLEHAVSGWLREDRWGKGSPHVPGQQWTSLGATASQPSVIGARFGIDSMR